MQLARFHRPLAAFVIAAASIGCNGSESPAATTSTSPSEPLDEHGFAGETVGWPESEETLPPWPVHTGGSSVEARWVPPRRFGCEERVWIRTDPSADAATPHVVIGNRIDERCRTHGSAFDVVDRSDAALASLFRGSCGDGYLFSTADAVLAAVSFGPSVSCADFEAARVSAAGARVAVHTSARLLALSPSPAVEVIAVRSGPGETLAVTDAP